MVSISVYIKKNESAANFVVGVSMRNQPRFPTDEYAINIWKSVWLAADNMPHEAPRVAVNITNIGSMTIKDEDKKNTGMIFCQVEMRRQRAQEFRVEKTFTNQ